MSTSLYIKTMKDDIMNQSIPRESGYQSRTRTNVIRLFYWNGAWGAATALMAFGPKFLWNRALVFTLLAVGLAGLGSALVDAALVMVFISAFGLVFPNAVHEAIHPLPEIAGLASALVTTTQMLFGALGGVAAAALYRDASPTALGAIMSASALAGSALYALWLRRKVEG